MNSNYTDYDTLQDRIINTYSGLDVRVTTKLYHPSTQSEENMRFFYNEFLRQSARISPTVSKSNSVLIRRDVDVFLTVAIKDYSTGVRASINIRPRSMNELIYVTQTVTGALMDPSTYTTNKDGALRIAKSKKKLYSIDIGFGQSISFQLIIRLDANENYLKGVRIYINNNDTYLDCSYDDFMAFSYFIVRMDLYSAAQSMLNQINIPLGTNRITMRNNGFYIQDNDSIPYEKELEMKEEMEESQSKKNPMTIAEQLKKAKLKNKETTIDDM